MKVGSNLSLYILSSVDEDVAWQLRDKLLFYLFDFLRMRKIYIFFGGILISIIPMAFLAAMITEMLSLGDIGNAIIFLTLMAISNNPYVLNKYYI